MKKTLSKETTLLVNSYLNLPIGVGCACPYFNNKRAKIRGGLSALVGKGTPEDIATEAKIIAIRKKVKLQNMDSDGLKKFLAENSLGVDCSGLAYHLLDTESKAMCLGSIASHIKTNRGFFRKIMYRLRPDMNTNVEVISSPDNSDEITIKDAVAGDVIVILNTGPQKTYNHILVISEISNLENENKIIRYIHSYAWPTDGKYGHGVRFGEIHILNPSLKLIQAKWIENGTSNENNYTYLSARDAEKVTIKRLKGFAKKHID